MSDIKSTVLYGAIIGDISGSPYEGDSRAIKTKDYKFIRHSGHFTDDTVMTIAVADALLTCRGLNEAEVKAAVTESMQRWGRKYPKAGYGHRFKGWLNADKPHPYKSHGNGAAMRVSPVALIAYLSNHFEFARDVARWTAEVTHNHPEAVKSVEAVASAINLAQHGVPKAEIKAYVENEFGYDLSRTLDEIRPTYHHEIEAAKSVPEAIIAFLESTDFEDAIRNAVSLGGDSDTLAAIAGSIAEAFYGVPDKFIAAVREKLPSEMRNVLDEINRVVRLQEDCHELDGNEDIFDAMKLFRATKSFDDFNAMIYCIDRQVKSNRCFIVPLEKVSEGTDADNYKPLTVYNEQANITFMSVFTDFYAFNKARRDNPQLKCTTTPIKNLLETCAQVNAKVQNSDEPANMALAINPNSDEAFYLPADMLEFVLDIVTSEDDTSTADEFDADKAQAYEALVAEAKARYREYNPKVNPSADDKQRTRDFADKFADKHKFWKALEYRCAKWEKSTDADINDKRARESLAIAVANGFNPKDAVALFAPTVDGGNICHEINLYTYRQGFGYAKKTPRIKYLLVGQDWGNFINTDAEFKSTVAKMNAGEDIFPAIGTDPTTINLVELFKILKRDVTKPCADVFFTNFCLGYRIGNEGSGMTKTLLKRDADLFRELCEILQPENILCLGRKTSECVYEALTGNNFRKIFGDAKSYNDFLDAHKCINVDFNGKTSQIYPLAHCGGMGKANRSLDRQRKDWRRIFDEQFETIFRDALYIIFEYPSSYPSMYYLDANGDSHGVELKSYLDKIFSRLPDFHNPDDNDWHFFYGGMGYYFLVNKKVLESYMRKAGIDKYACESWIDEKAALETIAELKH